MLVCDLRHFLDLPADTPGPARRLAEQLARLVRAATAAEPGAGWVSALPCQRRPGHRRCPGRMIVQRADPAGPIAWQCSACGDAGHISGWEDSPYDLRRRRPDPADQLNQIRIPDEIAETLRDLTLLDPDCERVVYGARAHGDSALLGGSDSDLDQLVGYVAAEANHEPNRRRQRRLDAAFTVLSEAAEHPQASFTIPVSVRDEPEAVRRPAETAAGGPPELDVARVQRWCAARVPQHARHQVRVECQVAAGHLTIVERRAPWHADADPEWTSLPIARLRYTKATRTWTLYWRDRNLRYHAYDPLAPSAHVDDLLTEIDQDPSGIFWG